MTHNLWVQSVTTDMSPQQELETLRGYSQEGEGSKHWCLVHFHLLVHSGSHLNEWRHQHLGRVFPPQPNADNPSLTHPEVCLQGNSRFC